MLAAGRPGSRSSATAFTWRYLDGDGNERGRSQEFAHRDEAESWLGQTWQDLLDQGHEEVALHDEELGERVYRMGLGEG